MKKHVREILRSARADLAGTGLSVTTEYGGSHVHLVLTDPSGQRRRVTFSHAPCHPENTVKLTARSVRRAAEEMAR